MLLNGYRQTHDLLKKIKTHKFTHYINSPEYTDTRAEIPAALAEQVDNLVALAKKCNDDLRVERAAKVLADTDEEFAKVWNVNFTEEAQEAKAPKIEITSDHSIPDLGYDLSHIDISGSLCAKLLQEYLGYSHKMSPESYHSFHDGGFWYLLSVIVQRRLLIKRAAPIYPNLYIGLCARSSVWSKSSCMKPVEEIMRSLSLHHLLHTGKETPEYFIHQATGIHVPEKYDSYDDRVQKRIRDEIASAGCGGLFIDELGRYLLGTRNIGGNMELWSRILLEWEDSKRDWKKATKTDGEEIVAQTYLSVFGAFTPSNFKEKVMEPMFAEGTMPRFLILAPPAGKRGPIDTMGEDIVTPPPTLLRALSAWNQRLIPPTVEIEAEYGKSSRPTYKIIATQPVMETQIRTGQGIRDEIQKYREACDDCVSRNQLAEVYDPFYRRYGTALLKVAALAASIDSSDTIEMVHMAIAFSFIEKARIGTHNFLTQVVSAPESTKLKKEGKDSTQDKIFARVLAKRDITVREIARALNLKAEIVKESLSAMEEAGTVCARETNGTKRYSPI